MFYSKFDNLSDDLHFFLLIPGLPKDGVQDMTWLSVLNEDVINGNLKLRYEKDQIYVSLQINENSIFLISLAIYLCISRIIQRFFSLTPLIDIYRIHISSSQPI